MLESIVVRLLRNRWSIEMLTVALIVSAVFSVTAMGQSGRRSTAPPTTSPSVSGPKTVEKKPAPASRLMLLVGIEDQSPLANIPYYLSDTVLDYCLRRLSDAADVIPKSLGRGISRSDASNRAKGEKGMYVVWLQLGSDLEDAGRQAKNGPDELYVRYTIFDPATGKVKQTGRSHNRIYRTGRGGISSRTNSKNSPLYSEYAVKQAAREAAERILEAFDITLRDQRVLQNPEQ